MSSHSRDAGASRHEISPAALALRASLCGVTVAAVIVGVLWLVLPAELLERGGTAFIVAGALTGFATGSIGNSLVAVGASRPLEDPTNSTGFLRAVVLDFALQILTVAGSMLGMFLNTVKFQHLAAFGITFAVVATACRITGTVLVSRALLARARHKAQGPDVQALVQDPQSR